MLFLELFSSSVAPLFVLIGVGVLIDKVFHLDIPTLSKLNFYVFSPVLLFAVIYDSQLQGEQIISIVVYMLAFTLVMAIVGFGISSLKFLRSKKTILMLGSILSNTGFYGIPLMKLAFGQFGVEIQAIVLIAQAFMTYTLGLIIINSDRQGIVKSMAEFFKYPMLYAMLLAIVLRWLHIPLIDPIRVPVDEITGGFIAIALIMLGAQLSRSEITGDVGAMGLMSLLRLVIGPITAFILLWLVFDFSPEIERVLLVSSGLPIAINVYVLAVEFDREPGFASRIVFWTTLLSGITIPVLLMLVN